VKALRFHRHGDPDVLVYEDVPDPEAAAGEVLVRVRACAVNGLDIFARRGQTETAIPLPMTAGADIAGEVAAVGAAVTGVAEGDRVVVNPRLCCGRCRACLAGEQSACAEYAVIGWQRPGGYAEYVAVPAANVRAIPASVSYVQAAAVPLAYTTAWRMLVARARLRPAETVLVLSGSGGVAGAAVQIAGLLGARVATTTGTAKLRRVAALGAELLIDHDTEDVTARVLEWTDGRGVDVLVQTQGGDTWPAGLEQVARLGRVVLCSALQGASPPEDLGLIAWKQLTIVGSTGATPLDFARVVDQLALGRLRPQVDSTFALADGAEGHRAFERHAHVGKVVLEV
jgi:NADPH:quinone reductase-like Zn-dependent oxidoreductase